MKTISLALASAATLALAAGVVHAQAPDRPELAIDMTRSQVEQRTDEAFARMDANDDGVLDAADRQAMQARWAERRAEHREARFEQLDANDDGALSRAEFDAAHDAEGGEGGEGIDGRGPGKHRMGRPAGGFGGFEGPGGPGGFAGFEGPGGPGGPGGMFGPGGAGADGEGDRALTKAEFTAAALERFDRADANRDGTLTAAERRAAMKSFPERPPAPPARDPS